ncbi:MAG: GNAT family N-acetyltransferase [Phycisphaerae bacterium]|nr:GNAT family N-acetyltransferase [Phycisphaerae bacterium]
MGTVCLHDKRTIEAALRRDVALNIYHLGDLDERFWPHTTWYAAERGGEIAHVALMYTGLSLPALLALTAEDLAGMRGLLESITRVLPRRFYCHLSRGLEPALSSAYRLDSHGTHLKMRLVRPALTAATDTAGAVLLSDGDREEVERLYADSYAGHWFEPQMLATRLYFGVRVDGRLVSVAGVHVHSAGQRVAALGNITTHPDFRGHGLARVATAAVCQALGETTDVVGLNVKADNGAAIRCYETLGFETVAEYEEYMATAP